MAGSSIESSGWRDVALVGLQGLGAVVFRALGPLALGFTVDDMNPALALRALDYGNFGILLILGNAGFILSTAETFRIVRAPVHTFWVGGPASIRFRGGFGALVC